MSFRDCYAGKLGDADLEERLLRNVDEGRFRKIRQTALEERLFALELNQDGTPTVREPDMLGNLAPAPVPGNLPAVEAMGEPSAWLRRRPVTRRIVVVW